jgi:uncharacterized protein YndB with AHSA1/START domain
MIDLNISTTIGAPIKRVYDFMSTPENDVQWQHGTLAAATIPNRDNAKGLFFRSIGHLLGRRNLGTYEVIESRSNLKYRFKSLSGPLYLQTTYTFETAGDGTRVNISMRVGAVKFPHTKEQILGRRLKKELKENLTALKGLLEGRHILPSV